MQEPVNDPVRQEYARLAPVYDRRWSFYIGATVQETERRLAVQAGERVLDVGCGTGVLLQVLGEATPGLVLTGADPSAEMLAVARRRLPQEVELREGQAEALPFPDASFDAVVSSSAFHYFRRPEVALAEMRRVLRSGGRLVITDWCDDYLTCRVCDFFLRRFSRAHRRTYRAVECAALLTAAGFARVAVERYRINWLWGLMTARAVKLPG